jgi:hypothetical protein
MEIRHLTQGMYALICASGTSQLHVVTGYLFQRSLKLTLYRSLVGLMLPPKEMGAVILNDHAQIAHSVKL